MHLQARVYGGFLALVGLAAGCAGRKAARDGVPVPGQQQPVRLAMEVEAKVIQPHLVFLPRDYSEGATRRWPLIVFLHGAGERGTNLARVAVHGPPKIAAARPDFPFVVISPQCADGDFWQVPALEALLDDALRRYAVDPRRVYLTGLSMGGSGTWAWATAHPERFAAIVPICGGGDPVPLMVAGGARKEALARLPVWAFHGARDTVVPLAWSERMIEALRRLGNQPKFTVYPEAGHDSWTAAYHDPALFEWLDGQWRKP